jgi:hypothetical protein
VAADAAHELVEHGDLEMASQHSGPLAGLLPCDGAHNCVDVGASSRLSRSHTARHEEVGQHDAVEHAAHVIEADSRDRVAVVTAREAFLHVPSARDPAEELPATDELECGTDLGAGRYRCTFLGRRPRCPGISAARRTQCITAAHAQTVDPVVRALATEGVLRPLLHVPGSSPLKARRGSPPEASRTAALATAHTPPALGSELSEPSGSPGFTPRSLSPRLPARTLPLLPWVPW